MRDFSCMSTLWSFSISSLFNQYFYTLYKSVTFCSNLAFQFISRLLNGVLTFLGYLMQKLSLKKNYSDAIEAITKKYKGVHAFTKSISPKVNVITWLEFEPAYTRPQSNAFASTPWRFKFIQLSIYPVMFKSINLSYCWQSFTKGHVALDATVKIVHLECFDRFDALNLQLCMETSASLFLPHSSSCWHGFEYTNGIYVFCSSLSILLCPLFCSLYLYGLKIPFFFSSEEKIYEEDKNSRFRIMYIKEN